MYMYTCMQALEVSGEAYIAFIHNGFVFTLLLKRKELNVDTFIVIVFATVT